MELKIVSETVDVRGTVFEGTPEQGFESDILLPDYCPDVRRILKCHVTPKISQCYQNGDKVNIDGFIFVKIYYLCDENKIHCYDSRTPFSKILELRENVDGVSVSVSAKTSYVNCRAVNQRRFDVRGAVLIFARVTGRISETVVSDATGGGIQLRKKSVTSSVVCGDAGSQFSVQEEGDIGSNPPVNAVLRSDGVVVVTDAKVIPNKVIVKGDLQITTLYTDADGTSPSMVKHTFPISRIVDIDGVTQESECEIHTDLISLETLPRQDENGEFTKLGFDAKINISAKAFDTRSVTAATDAYSTRYESSFVAKNVSFDRLVSLVDERISHRGQVELWGEEIERIIDLWACEKAPTVRQEDGKLITEIPIDVFAFFITQEGAAEFSEKSVTAVYEMPLDSDCSNAEFEPDVKILSCDYSFSAPNKAEVRLELRIVGSLLCRETDRCIKELTVDDTKPKAKDDSCALTIYYCDSGEDVWSIAKRYNTCAQRIMEENSMDSEAVTEKRVILIPSES